MKTKQTSKAKSSTEREWDVNAVVSGGRHLGRVSAPTGKAAVEKARRSPDRALCTKCAPLAEDLCIDGKQVTATEVGGEGEVYRSGLPTELSPAYQLVAHVWEHKVVATAHSWVRINGSMHSALTLAIDAGLYFDVGDFERIASSMRGSYWFGAGSGDNGFGEGFYSSAVEAGNDTACKSFEQWKGRTPFVFGGSRLHVGSILQWKDMVNAVVTSFAKDGTSFIACTRDTSEDRHSRKIARRVTITLDELRAAEKGRKAANKEEQEVAKLREHLRRSAIDLEHEVVAGWDKAQRAEALAWAKRGWNEHETPAPAFVTAAAPAKKSRRAA